MSGRPGLQGSDGAGQVHLGAPAQDAFGGGTVGGDVADVAQSIAPGDGRIMSAERLGQRLRHLPDGGDPRRTDVEWRDAGPEVRARGGDRRHRHVVYVDEVAALSAVLEDLGRLTLFQTGPNSEVTPAYGVWRGIPGP